jgi:DNA mismatch repair protein MutS2
MISGKAVGTLENIEKNKATVNYGVFLSKVSLDELELVEAMKSRRRCSDCSQFSVNRF